MDPTIALHPVRDFAASPHLDEATVLLAAAPLDAIGYGFTSSAYVIGADGEAQMVDRIAARANGIPVAATCAAAVDGLRRLGVERLAVVNPPWFDDELNSLGTAYFSDQGFDVVFSSQAKLPSGQREIEPADLYEFVRGHWPKAADGLFIGGNGLRAVGVIDALEADLDRPVLTANQALFWRLLGLAGKTQAVTGYGRLFELQGE
jgi:maleate isomerase